MTVEWTKKRVEMLEAQLEEKDRVIAHVENQVDAATDVIARHDRTISSKADQIANLIEKNENQVVTIKRLQEEAQDRAKRLNSQRRELEQAEAWKTGLDSVNRMLSETQGRLDDALVAWEREREMKQAFTAAMHTAMSDFGIKFGWVDDEELGFLEASADGVSAHISDLKSELDNIRTGR